MGHSVGVDLRGTRRRRLWGVVAVVLAVALLWAVEAGSPRHVDATGVDGLEVPLSAVEGADFVAVVDNPWLPLRPGSSWVHRGQQGVGDVGARTDVLTNTVEVLGVEATQVRTRTDGGETVHWYAQDVDGHVWLLGEEGVWSVADGTPAGLAMPAEPRRGDGFVRVPAPAAGQVPGEWWTIGERDEDVTVGGETYDEVLTVSGVRTVDGVRAEYEVELARGVGPVRRVDARGVLELVEHAPGDR